jgi:acyl carrier protein
MSQKTLTKAEIEAKIIEVLEEMTVDWDLDLKIGADTRLIEDLMFESVDIVRFVVALEQALNVKGLPFEKLFMDDGDYVEEILVSQAVLFLENNLS